MLIRYYGHVGHESGYGDAGHEFCMAILAAGFELEISTTGDRLPQRYAPLATCIKDESRLTGLPDVVIVHTLPLTCGEFLRKMRPSLPDAQFIAYTTWEGAEVASQAVVEALEGFDRVWVPSDPTAATMAHGGLGDGPGPFTTYRPNLGSKIDIVPHAFDEPQMGLASHACPRCGAHHALNGFQPGMVVDAPSGPSVVREWSQYSGPMYVRVHRVGDPEIRANYAPCELKLVPDDPAPPYRFYYIGAWNQRKNPQDLIRAYARAFRPSDNVELILQVAGVVPDMVRVAMLSTGLAPTEMPKVYYHCDRVTDAEIRRMHRVMDCFVTASRGESWNLPAFEAMLAGRHIIAPAGQGTDDYLLATSAALYDSRPVPAGGEVRILAPADEPGMFRAQYIGTQGLTVRQDWREPDLTALCICMRRAYLHRIRDLHVPYNPAERFGRRAVALQIRNLIQGEIS